MCSYNNDVTPTKTRHQRFVTALSSSLDHRSVCRGCRTIGHLAEWGVRDVPTGHLRGRRTYPGPCVPPVHSSAGRPSCSSMPAWERSGYARIPGKARLGVETVDLVPDLDIEFDEAPLAPAASQPPPRSRRVAAAASQPASPPSPRSLHPTTVLRFAQTLKQPLGGDGISQSLQQMTH